MKNQKERLKSEPKERKGDHKNGKREMEDGLLGAERLGHAENPTPKGGYKEAEDRDEDDVRKEDESRGGERPKGFINHLLSNLVSGGEAQEERVDKDQHDEEKRGIVSESDGPDHHEDKGGGLISNLISNLVSPRSPKAGKVTERKVEAFEDENGGSKAEEDEGSDGNGGLKQEKAEEEGGGGGIIENLVSYLPAPLQGNPFTPRAIKAIFCSFERLFTTSPLDIGGSIFQHCYRILSNSKLDKRDRRN